MITIKKFNNILIAILTSILLVGCFVVDIYAKANSNYLTLATKIISFIGILDFVLVIISYYQYKKNSDYIFMMLFFTSFFVFSFGEYIVYLIWPENSSFLHSYYSQTFDNNFYYVLKSGLFTLSSFNILYYGSILKKKSYKHNYNHIDFCNFERIILMIVSIPIILFKLKQFSVALQGGYEAARLLPIPGLINICEGLFISSLFILIYDSKHNIFYSIILTLYSFITIFIGNRTIGMSMFVVLILIYLLKKKNLIFNFKTILLVGLLGYILISIIVTVSDFRLLQNKNIVIFFSSLLKSITSGDAIQKFLSELGFNSLSLVCTMHHMDNHIFGMSYIASMLSVIPSSLDFMHLLDVFGEYIYLDEWLTQVMNIDFGSGYSLVAEAYLNFNIFGTLLFFIAGYYIDSVYINKDNNLFSIYKKLVLSFILFTLPRRTSLYFVDNYLYYILIPNVVMYLLFISKIHLTFRKRGKVCQNEI